MVLIVRYPTYLGVSGFLEPTKKPSKYWTLGSIRYFIVLAVSV